MFDSAVNFIRLFCLFYSAFWKFTSFVDLKIRRRRFFFFEKNQWSGSRDPRTCGIYFIIKHSVKVWENCSARNFRKCLEFYKSYFAYSVQLYTFCGFANSMKEIFFFKKNISEVNLGIHVLVEFIFLANAPCYARFFRESRLWPLWGRFYFS